VTLCTFCTPSHNAGLSLLKTRVADINDRWAKLSAAVERREVCNRHWFRKRFVQHYCLHISIDYRLTV